MSTLMSLPTDDVAFVGALDPLEQEVQQLFENVAQATPEARKLFMARLLQGVAGKLTADLSANALKAAQAQAAPPKTKTNQKPAYLDKNNKPEPWPGGGLLELHDHYDPIEGYQHFGRDVYYRIIFYETQTTLEHILAHHTMPTGPAPRKKSSGAMLAKVIIERLEKQFT